MLRAGGISVKDFEAVWGGREGANPSFCREGITRVHDRVWRELELRALEAQGVVLRHDGSGQEQADEQKVRGTGHEDGLLDTKGKDFGLGHNIYLRMPGA